MPTKIVRYIMEEPNIKKIIWAAIGDIPDFWFYALKLNTGHVVLLLGDGVSQTIVSWFDRCVQSALDLKSIRGQFGNDGSFVIWSLSRWACINVPDALLSSLRARSGFCCPWDGIWGGSFTTGKSCLNPHRSGTDSSRD